MGQLLLFLLGDNDLSKYGDLLKSLFVLDDIASFLDFEVDIKKHGFKRLKNQEIEDLKQQRLPGVLKKAIREKTEALLKIQKSIITGTLQTVHYRSEDGRTAFVSSFANSKGAEMMVYNQAGEATTSFTIGESSENKDGYDLNFLEIRYLGKYNDRGSLHRVVIHMTPSGAMVDLNLSTYNMKTLQEEGSDPSEYVEDPSISIPHMADDDAISLYGEDISIDLALHPNEIRRKAGRSPINKIGVK